MHIARILHPLVRNDASIRLCMYRVPTSLIDMDLSCCYKGKQLLLQTQL